MCSPVRCRSCSKVTWSGCGQHVDAVMSRVPDRGPLRVPVLASSRCSTSRPSSVGERRRSGARSSSAASPPACPRPPACGGSTSDGHRRPRARGPRVLRQLRPALPRRRRHRGPRRPAAADPRVARGPLRASTSASATRSSAIDRDRQVVAGPRPAGPARPTEEAYDALVLATGAAPMRPPIPGVELTYVLRDLADMDAIKARLDDLERPAHGRHRRRRASSASSSPRTSATAASRSPSSSSPSTCCPRWTWRSPPSSSSTSPTHGVRVLTGVAAAAVDADSVDAERRSQPCPPTWS